MVLLHLHVLKTVIKQLMHILVLPTLASGTSLAVTAVGESQHTVTNAVYTGSTGVMVVTSAGHGFSDGDYVKFDDDSLTFTCDLDNNATNHTYPRSTDRASNRWLQISNKTNDTFEVNVGVNTDGGTHAFVSATSNGLKRQTGTLTVNVGTSSNTTTHTFVSGLAGGVKFLPQTTHTFVLHQAMRYHILHKLLMHLREQIQIL